MLFADDKILIARKDNLQRAAYNLEEVANAFDLKLSVEKTKVMTFCGIEPKK